MQSQVDKTGWISALVGHHKGFSVFLSLYNFCMLNSAKVAKNIPIMCPTKWITKKNYGKVVQPGVI